MTTQTDTPPTAPSAVMKTRSAIAADLHPPHEDAQHAGALQEPGRPDRNTWLALRRGYRRKCPNCGSGPLMKGYLTAYDTCPVCREELHHHRADDGPAYLTILIVGHLMVPLLHAYFVYVRPEPLVLFTIFAVGSVGLSLYLLPRLKGAVIGFQWARYMGGFGV